MQAHNRSAGPAAPCRPPPQPVPLLQPQKPQPLMRATSAVVARCCHQVHMRQPPTCSFGRASAACQTSALVPVLSRPRLATGRPVCWHCSAWSESRRRKQQTPNDRPPCCCLRSCGGGNLGRLGAAAGRRKLLFGTEPACQQQHAWAGATKARPAAKCRRSTAAALSGRPCTPRSRLPRLLHITSRPSGAAPRPNFQL